MELGFEAAKGAAEKVLGVKLPIFMRMVLPGLLATAVLYRQTAWALAHLPGDADRSWMRLVGYGVLVLVTGALISTLNSEIYKIYEGRILWPRALRAWATAIQQNRVDRLLKATRDESLSDEEYAEIWYQLRVYPTGDKGEQTATHPTRIGNILAGYEQYPLNRYDMDSVFYWPRIWLQMDKDKKEEIDGQWSVADGFLTLSAIAVLGGGLWIVQALLAAFGLSTRGLPLSSALWAALAGFVWFVLGYGWYRLSLPFHRENGEVFKSVFDLYRDKVWSMTSLKSREKEAWEAAWLYLQYHLLKCPNCGQQTKAALDSCQNCGFGLAEWKRQFRDSGQFPE